MTSQDFRNMRVSGFEGGGLLVAREVKSKECKGLGFRVSFGSTCFLALGVKVLHRHCLRFRDRPKPWVIKAPWDGGPKQQAS